MSFIPCSLYQIEENMEPISLILQVHGILVKETEKEK